MIDVLFLKRAAHSKELDVNSENPSVLMKTSEGHEGSFARNARSSKNCFKVLGVRVDALLIAEVIAQMESWIVERNSPALIAATGMHGVTEAQHDASFKQVLNSIDLVVPDGMPLVWIGRLRDYELPHRVTGSELLFRFCEVTAEKRYKHFFYGGAVGVPGRLAQAVRKRIRELEVVGIVSPPFRPLRPEEDAQIVQTINDSEADVLWVGLGCPKQERWMHDHRKLLNVPVIVGIGAAFDFYTGDTPRAPAWMRENGLEWLFRLSKEPRRLWKRYLIYGSEFVFKASLELLSLRHFS